VLAARQRLRGRGEFSATIRAGRKAGRGCLVVYLAAGETGSARPPCAGFVVGRVVGSAVVRNTVRRRLRHLVRPRLNDLPNGAKVVVRALPEAAARDYAGLGEDLDSALAAVTRTRRSRPRRPNSDLDPRDNS
jgi:ribonuclease P protein component